jgi:hypothetical protein
MATSSDNAHWTRHVYYRSTKVKTTWKFRVGLVAFVLLVGWLTRGWLSVAIASSLVCDADVTSSDAILIENFDPTYLAFETAAQLRHTGVASRVLVPVAKSGDGSEEVSQVSKGVAELMANIAHLGSFEIIPIREIEPISLNAARDILQFIEREGIRSVIVVSPLFRSRRSALVYKATLGDAGIAVGCEPVRGSQDPYTWSNSWHGIQNAAEQWLKLQYYRLYVLPFKAAS